MRSQELKNIYLSRRPSFLSSEITDIDKVFSLKRLEAILQNPDSLKHTILAKVSDKTLTAPQHLDLSILLKALEKSVSIKLESIQLFDSKLESLRNEFFDCLDHPCDINCYLTPPFAQCFNPHFDDHDVFILQIEGEKSWKVDNKSKEYYPLESESFWSKTYQYSDPQSLTLRRGDVLFIPSGHVHHAQTLNGYSLHLTIGVHQMRAIDLLHEFLKKRKNENKRVFFNEPVAQSKEVQHDFDDELEKLVDGFQHIPDALLSQYEKEWNRKKMLDWARQPSGQQIEALMHSMSYDSSLCSDLLIRGTPHIKIEQRDEVVVLRNKDSHALIPIQYWEDFSRLYESSTWHTYNSILDGQSFMVMNHFLQDLIVKGLIECQVEHL